MSLLPRLTSPAAVAEILRRRGLSPQKRLGQNFLIDANILGRIVDSALLGDGDQVFEIGAGLGVLTQALAEKAGPQGRVVSVEIDRGLQAVLAETLAGLSQVKVIAGDALGLDLARLFATEFDERPISAVANIPYQITTPLIASLIDQKRHLARMVLLVQREVALRLTASPASPDYGAFTVYCQYHAVVENLFAAPRTVFFPPPEVTSAVVRLTPRPAPPAAAVDESVFFAVVRAGFGQRRKTLSNALSNDRELGWSKERALGALSRAGVDPQRRAETLSLAEFAAVANGGTI